MTPVEERIDHDQAKRTAEVWARGNFIAPWEHANTVIFQNIARAYLALLTEHSAREQLVQALEETLRYMERVRHGDPSLTSEEYYIVRDFARKALPATESAQPEEEPND